VVVENLKARKKGFGFDLNQRLISHSGYLGYS
jgi:hypothetical protein